MSVRRIITCMSAAQTLRQAEVTKFISYINGLHRLQLSNYKDLHAWTTANESLFYEAVWKWYNLIGDIGQLPVNVLATSIFSAR